MINKVYRSTSRRTSRDNYRTDTDEIVAPNERFSGIIEISCEILLYKFSIKSRDERTQKLFENMFAKSEFEFFYQNEYRSFLKFYTEMKHGFERMQVKIQPGLNQVKNYSEINSNREMREPIE